MREHLGRLATGHRVPGASLAILDRDEIQLEAAGVSNIATEVETTVDTLFQIGSITKIYNATLVMQLVDEGRVDLDAPVKTYLPELQFADAEATEAITLRQLLTHTSGLDGDFFKDTGRGDDCIKRYVEQCATIPLIAPPGALFSYCNAGFCVTGHLVEVLTGLTWDAALKDRLFAPLGANRSVTLPEEALLHHTAVGHIVNPQEPDGDLIRTPYWHFPRGTGPAGNIVATANDLLSFVRMHLDEGVGADGTKILSAESVRSMQQPQIQLPDRVGTASAWGIGWMIYDWDGTKVLGHNGGTPGQSAFLRIVPEERFAVALLTNGTTGAGLCQDLFTKIFAERGITIPKLPEADDQLEFDPIRFAGRYERCGLVTTIEIVDGNRLAASLDQSDPELVELGPEMKGLRLRPLDQSSFLVRLPGQEDDITVVFFDDDANGRPSYLHAGGRASRRVS